MKVSADRVSGAFFLLLGLAMVFVVNPRYIESVNGGNLAPDTVPNIVSIIIAVFGGLLLIKPTASEARDKAAMVRAALYVALLALGIFAMSRFGFEIVAPVLALIIMISLGERKPLWLLLGTIAMPALIWFMVVHALGRALP